MSALANLLCRKDIVDKLNGISEKFLAESEQIICSKEKADSYPAVDERNLAERLAKVSALVNEFVDFHPQMAPEIYHDSTVQGSGYLWRWGKIKIGISDMAEDRIDAAIAHEYSHFIQWIKDYTVFQWGVFGALSEGFAMGVELQIARVISKDKNDTNYLIRIVEDTRNYLDAFLFNAKSGMPQEDEEKWRYKYGTASFLLAEDMHGDAIYRRILRSSNPYRFLLGLLDGIVNLEGK